MKEVINGVMNSDIRKLLRQLVADGWKPVRSRNKYKMYDPNNESVFVCVHCTHSDVRAVKNLKALVYRISGRKY